MGAVDLDSGGGCDGWAEAGAQGVVKAWSRRRRGRNGCDVRVRGYVGGRWNDAERLGRVVLVLQ